MDRGRAVGPPLPFSRRPHGRHAAARTEDGAEGASDGGIVVGRFDREAPATTKPTGVSPNEPNWSKLSTRERRCSGTSSVISVIHAAVPMPIQPPRSDTFSDQYQGDSASTIPMSLIERREADRDPPFRGCQRAQRATRDHPAAMALESNPYEPTPGHVVLDDAGRRTVNGDIASIRIRVAAAMPVQIHGTLIT